MKELLIVGGELGMSTGLRSGDLLIRDGRIADLFASGAYSGGAERIDARGCLVLPGIIDSHFHCRAPGHPEREDFTSGTSAAAAGGVTTILEMPIALPGVHSAAVLDDRRGLAERDAVVDFGLWGGGGAPAEDIRAMATAGAVGFKIFLPAAAPGREDEFEGLTVTTMPHLHSALATIAETGLPAAVHCEDGALAEEGIKEAKRRGLQGLQAHASSRPPFVEAVAVSAVLELAAATGAHAYLAHMSTGRALQLAAHARSRGQVLTFETCPQYLLVAASTVADLGPYAKVNPPLREREDVDALWQGLLQGAVDIVGSDHGPYAELEKERGWTDIFDAPSGSPGVETLGPLLVDQALRGNLTWARLVEVAAANPARVFRLDHRKGRIAPGLDADITIIDPSSEDAVDRSNFLTRSRSSARMFEGRRLRGRIRQVLVRGTTVYLDGVIVAPTGHGAFVQPRPA